MLFLIEKDETNERPSHDEKAASGVADGFWSGWMDARRRPSGVHARFVFSFIFLGVVFVAVVVAQEDAACLALDQPALWLLTNQFYVFRPTNFTPWTDQFYASADEFLTLR